MTYQIKCKRIRNGHYYYNTDLGRAHITRLGKKWFVTMPDGAPLPGDNGSATRLDAEPVLYDAIRKLTGKKR